MEKEKKTDIPSGSKAGILFCTLAYLMAIVVHFVG